MSGCPFFFGAEPGLRNWLAHQEILQRYALSAHLEDGAFVSRLPTKWLIANIAKGDYLLFSGRALSIYYWVSRSAH